MYLARAEINIANFSWDLLVYLPMLQSPVMACLYSEYKAKFSLSLGLVFQFFTLSATDLNCCNTKNMSPFAIEMGIITRYWI